MHPGTPPFSITNRMLELVSSISEKIGRIGIRADMRRGPHLRKNSSIASIHASLKIEANSLSLSEVRDVINGRPVMGDAREIQEVKNAYAAYELMDTVDPFSIDDLKKVHGIMTAGLVRETGTFRKGNEGVFAGDACVFVAPPPHMVPSLVENLFNWMRDNRDTVHPLILSSVFHYEFVFIHPFSDGNGRMARFWQTAILNAWRKLFAYIPLESRIEKFQQEYYDAISECHGRGSSDVFVEFMLERIEEIIDETETAWKRRSVETSGYVSRMLACMEYDVPYTAVEIMRMLRLTSRSSFRKIYLAPALELGLVEMTLPQRPNSRNQRYVKR